jgi:RNA polymerase sigma-70 factor (ECF subfamily)
MNNILASLSEEDIINRIVSGEKALFEVLIRRYNEPLYKIARSYGYSHDESMDLLQESHISAYEGLSGFEGRSSYKTWIAKIMVRKCLYRFRYGAGRYEKRNPLDENSKPLFAMKEDQAERRILNRELAHVLEKSLERIPLHYRIVFIMREVEGFSVAETAELLNLTPVNVKVRVSRARLLLQKEVEKYYSKAQLYDFDLVYCDKVVENVFNRIK